MVVLPLDQPAAALSLVPPREVFATGEKKGRAGDGEMSNALLEDSPSPCKSAGDCAGEGSMRFELIWALLGEMAEVGRASVARQRSPYIRKINPIIMERMDTFCACCLFLSSSVILLARIPAAASGSKMTF